MRSFFAELKRRNVFAAMAFLAAAGWLLVQVATQVVPFYDVPQWVRLVIAGVLVGIPFALVLSWVLRMDAAWLATRKRNRAFRIDLYRAMLRKLNYPSEA